MYKFTIYTISECNYCSEALNLLERLNFDKEIIEVDEDEKYNVKIKNGMSTFPQIFLQYSKNDELINELIGGYNDLLLLVRIVTSIEKNFSICTVNTLLDIYKSNLDDEQKFIGN